MKLFTCIFFAVIAVVVVMVNAQIINRPATDDATQQQQQQGGYDSQDAYFSTRPDAAFSNCPMWCRCVLTPTQIYSPTSTERGGAYRPPQSRTLPQQQQQQFYKNVTCAIQPGFIDRFDRWLQNNPLDRDIDILFFSYTPLSAERLELNEQASTVQLAPVFAQFTQLKILGLSNVGLESIPPVTADQLGNTLVALYLDNNNISRIGALNLQRMRQLELVDLSQNPIMDYNTVEKIFPPKLHSIGFGYNALSRLPVELVRAVPTLRWLDLTGNQISTVEQSAIDEILTAPRLEYVRLQDNPLRCDVGSGGSATAALFTTLRKPAARLPLFPAAAASSSSSAYTSGGLQQQPQPPPQKNLRDVLCGFDGQCPRCLTPVSLRGVPIDEFQL